MKAKNITAIHKENITLVKKVIEEIYTKGDFLQAEHYLTDDLRLIDPASPNFRGGLRAFIDRELMFKTAFPNKKTTLDDIVATDDCVVTRWTCQATHKGEFLGIAPTNKNITITGISMYFISKGKITEIAQQWDRLGLLDQLGVVETPFREAAHR